MTDQTLRWPSTRRQAPTPRQPSIPHRAHTSCGAHTSRGALTPRRRSECARSSCLRRPFALCADCAACQPRLDIIKDNPIGNGLDAFHTAPCCAIRVDLAMAMRWDVGLGEVPVSLFSSGWEGRAEFATS